MGYLNPFDLGKGLFANIKRSMIIDKVLADLDKGLKDAADESRRAAVRSTELRTKLLELEAKNSIYRRHTSKIIDTVNQQRDEIRDLRHAADLAQRERDALAQQISEIRTAMMTGQSVRGSDGPSLHIKSVTTTSRSHRTTPLAGTADGDSKPGAADGKNPPELS